MRGGTTKELRTAGDVAGWLAAGLLLRRVSSDSPEEDAALVSQAIVACANELSALPPPGVIADLAVLLGGARLPLPGPIAADDAVRAGIHAYDDDVLARLVTGARWDDVVAAYAHLAPALRQSAIALIVGAVCERAGFAGAQVSPATLRRALAKSRDEREATGREELAGGATSGKLADAYVRLARGARQCRALVDDREVFAVDHLAVLRDLGGRMTADHIGAAAEAFMRALPRRMPAKRQQRGARDTRLADDTLYPAGGFSAITPGGSNASIENLVTSELVYMEDGPDVDIFTLRYVEGELLYYTRDDSVFRRHKHVIGVALGADLDDARVKDRDLPWQRLVLAFGMLVAAIRWLTEQLGDQALTIHVAFPKDLLGEERQIFSLLLEGEIARGAVIVDETDAIAATDKAGDSAIADVIVMSLGPVPELPRGLRAIHVDLAGSAPTVAELAPRKSPPGELGPDSWTEWCEAAVDLLRWLV